MSLETAWIMITTFFFCNLCDESRVRTGPGKPGKFWNSIVALSRTGESWKMDAGPGKVWKSEITQVKNMKFMADSKDNEHWDFGSGRVHVSFRVLEKSIWVLEESWKFVSEKGTNSVNQVINLISYILTAVSWVNLYFETPNWFVIFYSFICLLIVQECYFKLGIMQNQRFFCPGGTNYLILIIYHFLTWKIVSKC